MIVEVRVDEGHLAVRMEEKRVSVRYSWAKIDNTVKTTQIASDLGFFLFYDVKVIGIH